MCKRHFEQNGVNLKMVRSVNVMQPETEVLDYLPTLSNMPQVQFWRVVFQINEVLA